MKKYARLDNGKVVELFETAGDITTMFHPDIVWVDVTSITGIAEGWIFDGVTFASPAGPNITDIKDGLADAVDDAIARIYSRFTRFSDEYRLREAQAQAFIDAGYTGVAGILVHGYAVTQAGMTDQQAADIIIVQASALRAALTVLGNLRMRKNEIKAAAVVDGVAAQAIHDEIIALANAAVVGL